MTSRRFIWGLLAIPLSLAAMPMGAQAREASPAVAPYDVAVLGGLFGREGDTQRPHQPLPGVQLAQAGDPRIISLEEQIRALNGRVEELNFLILQMQEQLRKQQEDNDLRFQELEDGNRGGGNGNRTDAAPQPRDNATSTAGIPANGGAGAPAGNSDAVAGVIAGSGSGDQNSLPGVPGNLGTIRFDESGNLVGGTVEQPVELIPNNGGVAGAGQSGQAQNNSQVAALPATDDPDELYRNSYEFILSGDYKSAEAGFRSYIERFPDQPRTADASFWLGEALVGQKRHRDAAEVFLAASRDHPDSRKGPDTLLKLGMSLAAMQQNEVACATFREVGSRYPNASDALKERVRQEIASNRC